MTRFYRWILVVALLLAVALFATGCDPRNAQVAASGGEPTPTLSLKDIPIQWYIVQSGDTLSGLAWRCGISIDELRELNRIHGITQLTWAGHTIALPAGRCGLQPGPSPTPLPKEPEAITMPVIYRVRPGDTLFLIASRYWQLSVRDLKAANGLTDETIYVGQELCIPVPGRPETCKGRLQAGRPEPQGVGSPIIYRVQPGDTLSLIASRYKGVSVEDLKAANGLTGDLIYAGQDLCIPVAGHPETCRGR